MDKNSAKELERTMNDLLSKKENLMNDFFKDLDSCKYIKDYRFTYKTTYKNYKNFIELEVQPENSWPSALKLLLKEKDCEFYITSGENDEPQTYLLKMNKITSKLLKITEKDRKKLLNELKIIEEEYSNLQKDFNKLSKVKESKIKNLGSVRIKDVIKSIKENRV
jgi:hypothetical protein